MEISKQQQIKRACNTVLMVTDVTRTWDQLANAAHSVIWGMELEISLRDVLENWPYPIQGNFDPSKYPKIDKTGIELIYGN